MRVPELITVDRIACNAEAASKKRALEVLSSLISGALGATQGNPEDRLSPMEVFDSLMARERLGSTGLGHGVALPHGRAKKGDQTVVAFARLAKGIDFDAVDREPVDLLFAMLVPEKSTDEHLQLLAQLAEMFSRGEFRESLRHAPDAAAIYGVFQNWPTEH
jgi:PTS system nitrogen regulatory IIA component